MCENIVIKASYLPHVPTLSHFTSTL